MDRLFTTASCVVLLAGAMVLAGCGGSDTSHPVVSSSAAGSSYLPSSQPAPARPSNTKRLSSRDLLDQLAAAGLGTEDLGAPRISLDDSSRFPEDARSTLLLRVSDGQGNSEPMTFVEFGSWKAAAKLDAKPVNGFAVRNWFVLGTTSNHFVKLVSDALSQ
ncbi:MAG: hypothetical protein DHS20C21_13550 [Gemmatimonadota bacterium]|nr:MAG: hypothetical protein DHS20C21_13550 [Gemmatimonadota bacterium]